MRHKHKFGEIRDGYQYCTECNKAEPVECSHIWENVKVFEVTSIISNTTCQVIYVLMCKNCGEVKEKRI